MTGRRKSTSHAGRSLVVLALVAPTTALLLGTSATLAFASGSFTGNTPSEGQVLSTNSFTVEASGSATKATTLTVTGVDAAGSTVCTATSSSNASTLTQNFKLTMSFPSSTTCTTTRNAQWSAQLTGGASGSRSFTTNAAPAQPSGFVGQGSGARDVSFSWNRGSEPDLIAYALYDDAGHALKGSISLDHCSGNACSYGLYYQADNPGSHGYELAAVRAGAGCSSCGGGSVESSHASTSATLVKPPPPPPPSPTASPTPSPTPTSGGTTSGGTTAGGTTGGRTTGGGKTTGGTGASTGGTVQTAPKTPTLPKLPDAVTAARRAFALQFNAFSPSLNIAKLPPLPAAFAPLIAGGEGPLPQGTYQPSLPYQPTTVVEKKTTVLSQFASVGQAVNVESLAKSIAAALVLLMIGAHLRRFLAVKGDD